MAAHFADERYRDLLDIDPVRLIEAVVACVGFVAAGTILRARPRPRARPNRGQLAGDGLAIGVAAGLGEFVLGLGVTLLCLLVLAVLGWVAWRLPRRRVADLALRSVDRGVDAAILQRHSCILHWFAQAFVHWAGRGRQRDL